MVMGPVRLEPVSTVNCKLQTRLEELSNCPTRRKIEMWCPTRRQTGRLTVGRNIYSKNEACSRHVTPTASRSVCLGVKHQLRIKTRILLLLLVAVLSMWGALSDERTSLSFTGVRVRSACHQCLQFHMLSFYTVDKESSPILHAYCNVYSASASLDMVQEIVPNSCSWCYNGCLAT
jgi:hypothetical protein